MTSSRALKSVAIGALCAVFVTYVAYSFQWTKIAGVLADAPLAQMLLSSSVAILAYLGLRTARWTLLLRATGHPVPAASAFEFTSLAVGIAVLTPASAAEFLKVEWLRRRERTGRAIGYSSFVAERALDGLVLIVIAAAGSALSGLVSGAQSAALMIAGAVAVSLLLAFMLGRRNTQSGGMVAAVVGTFTLGYRAYAPALVLTVLGWLCIGLGWQACFSGLSLQISFLDTLTVMALSTVLSVLSFIPAGLGISEASIALLLELLGAAPASAQAGALAIRAFGLLVLALGVAASIVSRYMANVAKTSS